MKDFSKMLGWEGEDLPDAVQSLIVMRKFAAACAVMAANFQRTYEEVSSLLSGCEPQEVAERLAHLPFYRAVMERLAEALEDPDFNIYRENAQTLYELVRGYNSDSVIALAYAMWVADGADLPEGLLELVKKVEEADDASQELLDTIQDQTGDSE